MSFLAKYKYYKQICEGTIKSLIPFIQKEILDNNYGVDNYQDLTDEQKDELPFLIEAILDDVEDKVNSITSNAQYKSWIYDILKNQDKQIHEDYEVIKDAIADFEKLCKRPDLTSEQKNIQNYKHFQDLQEFIISFQSSHNMNSDLYNCFKKIYKNSKYTLYYIGENQYSDCNRLFGGNELFNTGWCVAKNEYYFKHYLEKNPDIYGGYIVWINNSDNKPFALLHYGSHQFKDVSDKPIKDTNDDMIIDGLGSIHKNINDYSEDDLSIFQKSLWKYWNPDKKDMGYYVAFCVQGEYNPKTKTIDCSKRTSTTNIRFQEEWLDENGTFDFTFTNITRCQEMFRNLVKLTKIPDFFTIPEGVHSIGYMFADCPNLHYLPNNFRLPQSLEMCYGMFYNSGIYELPEGFTIPEKVYSCSAMFSCSKIKSLPNSFRLPEAGSSKGICCEEMFDGCVNLTELPTGFIIPKNATGLKRMFSFVYNLKHINGLTVKSRIYSNGPQGYGYIIKEMFYGSNRIDDMDTIKFECDYLSDPSLKKEFDLQMNNAISLYQSHKKQLELKEQEVKAQKESETKTITEGTIKSSYNPIQQMVMITELNKPFDFPYNDLTDEEKVRFDKRYKTSIHLLKTEIEHDYASLNLDPQFKSWLYDQAALFFKFTVDLVKGDLPAGYDEHIHNSINYNIPELYPQFKAMCRSPKVSSEAKDIRNYKSIEDFKNTVIAYMRDNTEHTPIHFEKTYSNDTYDVYKVYKKDKDEFQHIYGEKGYNCGWCVVNPDKNMFVKYLDDRDDKFYYLWTYKNTSKPFALLHKESYQFKDIHNSPFNLSSKGFTQEIYDVLLHIFTADEYIQYLHDGDFQGYWKRLKTDIRKNCHSLGEYCCMLYWKEIVTYDKETNTVDCHGNKLVFDSDCFENGTFDFKIINHNPDWSEIFYNCDALTHLPEDFVLPENTTSCEGMFCYCDNLEKLPENFTIPSNVRNCIDMFNDCEKLRELPHNFKFNNINAIIDKGVWLTIQKMFCGAKNISYRLLNDILLNSGFPENKIEEALDAIKGGD